MDLAAAKQRLAAEVERRADLLVDVSHRIHDHPELAYDEHHAHDLLCDVLEAEGLATERGAFGLDTAFVARAGSSGPTVAVCCEYDALPEIGHACGHNIIAAAGLGAGLAAASLADELGGRVVVLGTPAEEGGGGKVHMIERGALRDVDAALMVHPASADLEGMHAIAVQQILVEYFGEAAHAAAAPHLGRNALDAAVLGYTNVAALRQHIEPDERIHGIIVKGGDKPNIVPAHTVAHWYVRSRTVPGLDRLVPRVLACLEAGALAAGCRMEHTCPVPVYADVRDNLPMVDLYRANVAERGRTLLPADAAPVVGSTDMGNVSYAVPSIHPMIAVAPRGVAIHTPAFAVHARAPEGDRAVVDGAAAMAMTIADLWLDPSALERARAAHVEVAASGPGGGASTAAVAP